MTDQINNFIEIIKRDIKSREERAYRWLYLIEKHLREIETILENNSTYNGEAITECASETKKLIELATWLLEDLAEWYAFTVAYNVYKKEKEND